MTTDPRNLGHFYQGKDESLSYQFSTTDWGGSPTGIACSAFDITNGAYTDVSSTVLSNLAYASGDDVVTKYVGSLTEGHTYRIETLFTTADGNTFDVFFTLECVK